MADSLIGIDIRGMKELQAKLKAWPKEAQDAGSEAAAKFLLNVERTYPPYMYVSRSEAYPFGAAGPGWQSDRQRKFVMAGIRSGAITPGKANRTQRFSKNWKIIDKGVDAFLVNETSYGPHLKDPQSKHMRMIGWTTIDEDIKKHWDGMM